MAWRFRASRKRRGVGRRQRRKEMEILATVRTKDQPYISVGLKQAAGNKGVTHTVPSALQREACRGQRQDTGSRFHSCPQFTRQ